MGDEIAPRVVTTPRPSTHPSCQVRGRVRAGQRLAATPSRMSLSLVSSPRAPRRAITAVDDEEPGRQDVLAPDDHPGVRQARLGLLGGQPVAPRDRGRQGDAPVVVHVSRRYSASWASSWARVATVPASPTRRTAPSARQGRPRGERLVEPGLDHRARRGDAPGDAGPRPSARSVTRTQPSCIE